MQETSKRLSERARHEHAYNEAVSACKQWQQTTRQRLDAAIALTDLDDQRDVIKEVKATLDEGQQLLAHVREASQWLLPTLPFADVTSVTQETEALQAENKALHSDVTSHLEKVTGKLEALRNFSELQQELARWLTEVESQVTSGEEPRAELAEKRAQLDKFKVSDGFVSCQELIL